MHKTMTFIRTRIIRKLTYYKRLSVFVRVLVFVVGLVSGEHGIGSGKVKYLVDSVGETNMAIMEGIKRVFDPKMILNPGKVCYRL